MERKKIRVFALAGLVVAAGGYVWAQRSASTVKPAPTNAAMKKPGAVTPGARPTAPPAKSGVPVANARPAGAPIAPPAKGTPAAPVASAPAAVPTAKTPAAVPPPAAAAVTAKTPAPNATAKPAMASAPVAAPLPAPLPALPVEAAAWQDHLQKGAYLAETLKPRLPDGTDLLVASGGFRDLQQFVSAVTASHNLKIDFEELKRRLVTDGKGLAPAIDAMKKVASATIEEQRAEYEARGLIQEAKRHPLPAPPPPKAVKAATPKPQSKKPARTQSGF